MAERMAVRTCCQRAQLCGRRRRPPPAMCISLTNMQARLKRSQCLPALAGAAHLAGRWACPLWDRMQLDTQRGAAQQLRTAIRQNSIISG